MVPREGNYVLRGQGKKSLWETSINTASDHPQKTISKTTHGSLKKDFKLKGPMSQKKLTFLNKWYSGKLLMSIAAKKKKAYGKRQ